jgi:plasmid stabilization system protein ParE
MKVVWSIRALNDLDAIAEYIARDDALAARRWIDKIKVRAIRAARVPGTGRVVPEYRRPDIREVLLRSYRILYALQPRRCLVLRVIEGHQRLPGLRSLLIH